MLHLMLRFILFSPKNDMKKAAHVETPNTPYVELSI